MKIIATDDEKFALEELKDAIYEAKKDADLTCFSSPKEAIAFCENNKVDVAFLDINMRGMNGIALAKKLKEKNPYINVIFVTGYDEYMSDAIDLHCSGYIMKPVTGQAVKKKLDNLLFDIKNEENRIVEVLGKDRPFAKTFGNFDLFHQGKPLSFGDKPKEFLAYLIDRGGSSVSRKEICAVLFEDEIYDNRQNQYLSVIFLRLRTALSSAGLENIIVKQHNSYAVNTSLFDCDLYNYRKGNPDAINAFHGEYMTQYSWAESTLVTLYND